MRRGVNAHTCVGAARKQVSSHDPSRYAGASHRGMPVRAHLPTRRQSSRVTLQRRVLQHVAYTRAPRESDAATTRSPPLPAPPRRPPRPAANRRSATCRQSPSTTLRQRTPRCRACRDTPRFRRRHWRQSRDRCLGRLRAHQRWRSSLACGDSGQFARFRYQAAMRQTHHQLERYRAPALGLC